MATLGELVAKLSLDIAQFTGALGKVERETANMRREVTKSFQDMGNDIAKHAAKWVSAAAAVHAFGEAFKSSMEHASQLQELSNAIDVPVAELDKMTLALKISGVSVEQYTKYLKTLSAQMVEATNPTSKAAELFKAMGISVTDASGKLRSQNDVFKDVIKQLALVEEPALRAKLAQELLGKGAEAALAATKELTENIAKAEAQLAKYGVTTDEVAAQSKEFSDQLELAKDAGQRMMMPIVQAVLPALADLVDAFGDNVSAGKDFANAVGTVLAVAVRSVGTIIIITVGAAKQLGLALAGVAAIASTLGEQGGLKRAKEIFADMGREMDANTAATQKSLASMWGYKDATAALNDESAKVPVNQEAARRAVNNTKDGAKEAAAAAAALKKELEELAKLYNWAQGLANAFEGGASFDPQLLKDLEKLHEFLDEFPQEIDIFAAALQELWKKAEGGKFMKQYIDDLRAWEKEQDDVRDAIRKNITTIGQQNDVLEDEVAVMRLVGTQRELAISMQQRQHQVAGVTLQDDKDEINALYDKRDALIESRGAIQAEMDAVKLNTEKWQDFLKTAEDYSKSFVESWGEGMKGVSDWAKRVGADLKKYLLDVLYELTVKKWVVQLVGAMSGGVSGAGTAQSLGTDMLSQLMGGGSGGGGMMSTAGNWLAGLFSGGAGAAGGAAFAASQGGGLASLFAAGGSSALATSLAGGAGAATTASVVGGGGMTAAFGAATGGASALATEMAVTTTATATLGASMVAMIPVIGAIIAVAYIAYTMLSQAQGGAKEGGFATSGIRAEDVPGGRYYTPDHADADIKPLVDAMANSYKQAVESLGGTARDLGFAFGYDTDPQGTAQSRVSAGVYGAGGEEIFKSLNLDAGRDDAGLQAAIDTQSKRALLAALQASDLPTEIAQILDVVVASAASSDDVTNIIATAGAMHGLMETIAAMEDPLGDAAKAWDLANQTALEGWNRQREALHALADTTPTTAEGIANLTTNIQGMYVSTMNLLTGIMRAKQGMDDMFGATRDTIEKAALTPDQLYEREQAKARKLFGQLSQATDPDEILRISEQLNQTINSAFSMLTPEQQAAKSAEFLAGLDKVQEEADKRLDASMKTIADQANTDREFYTSKIKDITDAVVAAADTFNTGASRVANMRDHNVNIHVEDDRLTTEVTYGGDYGGSGGDGGGQ
jgi:TP901 family phage tail tape measure protein